MKLKIDPEFQSLMPKLSDEEYASLDETLQREGCTDPIRVWRCGKDLIIVDGHNRYEICGRYRMAFTVHEISLADRDAAIEWIVDNQLARRNLTDKQRAYYIGKEYLAKKKQQGGDRRSKSRADLIIEQMEAEEKSKAQSEPLIGDTATEVAEKHGVGRETVKRNAEFAEAVDKLPPEEKAEVLNGKSKKTKGEIVAAAAEPADDEGRPLRDKVNAPIPDRAAEAFHAGGEINRTCLDLDKIIARIREMASAPGGRLIHADSITQQLKQSRQALHRAIPTHVCPYCQGAEKKTCRACNGEGWTNQTYFDQAPEEKRQAMIDMGNAHVPF